jgi:DNA-binding NarL/FixJ family response regulator
MTRVLVVDDHPMWREAVARDLGEAGFEVVGTLGEGARVAPVAQATRPDVVVLDLQLPDLAGVDVIAALAEAVPSSRVLVLSASGERQDVLAAVKAGAMGYLVKSASRDELVDAVRRTAAGEEVLSPELAGLLIAEFRRMRTEDGGGSDRTGLTDREVEVLRMVAKGMSYRDIAARLGVSHRTVQNHVQNVLGKLHLHNRVQLTRYVLETGLDDPAD